MKSLFFTILICFTVAFTTSCSWTGNCINGVEEIASKTIDIEKFNSISLLSHANVYVSQSDQHKVSIKAKLDVIELLNTDVNADRWVIKFTRCVNSSEPIDIYIETPDYEEIEIGGSGNIFGKGLMKQDELELSINGSGNINLHLDVKDLYTKVNGSGSVSIKGKAKESEVKINGSGDVNAFELLSDNTEVKVNGSGDVNVYSSNSLEVKINGSGDVNYKGAPQQMNSSVNGSGKLQQAN